MQSLRSNSSVRTSDSFWAAESKPMASANLTLLQQLNFTAHELEQRLGLFDLDRESIELLAHARPHLEPRFASLVNRFYHTQMALPEVVELVGDAGTLLRLKTALRRYVGELFLGQIDLDYVETRLRIGLVHWRLRVEPKLYMTAVHQLKRQLERLVLEVVPAERHPQRMIDALEKLIHFDATLVFDTYIHSMHDALERERRKSEQHAERLQAEVTARTQELEAQARTDALTGLRNGRSLLHTLNRELHAAERRGEPLSVAYVDLDHFKAINDEHGHLQGDQVLRFFADRLRECVRVEDTLFRLGGDEFCALLPRCDASEALALFEQRLQPSLQSSPVPLSFSVGVAQAGPQSYPSPDELLRSADGRMYEHKRESRAESGAPSAEEPGVELRPTPPPAPPLQRLPPQAAD